MDVSYTKYIEYNMWSYIDNLDEEMEYASFINFLNSDEFRSFGEGIAYLIKKKDEAAEITADNLGKYLKAKCEENGISLSDIGSRNTFKAWFDGSRPDKKAANREKLFSLAFALKLDIEEVKYLFHNVYLDRAFDYRNYKETVYYYCIANGYDYAHANDIIRAIEENNKDSQDGMCTKAISREIEAVKTDEELVDWICKRWNNFQYNNKTAIENFKELFDSAKKLVDREYTMYPESFDKPSSVRENTTTFMYSVILNCFSEKADSKFNSVFENKTNINSEIKTNFPSINSLCEIARKVNTGSSDKNYDELRKNIILLKFYTFFENALLELGNKYGRDNDSEEYRRDMFVYREKFIEETNDRLSDCGMCELYVANPYDLLFVVCAYDMNPVDTLRGIIAEIKYPEENMSLGNSNAEESVL